MTRILTTALIVIGLAAPAFAGGNGVPKALTLTVDPNGRAAPKERLIAQPGFPRAGISVKKRGSRKAAAQFSINK